METIALLRKSFNDIIENKINKLKEQQKKAMEAYDNAEKVVNVLPKIYKRLKFTEYDKICVSDNGFEISFNCSEDFKPYMFVGYNKNGASKNRNKCLTKSEKYANVIKDHIYSTLGIKTEVHVNPSCFEHHYTSEPTFVLVNIYFKD